MKSLKTIISGFALTGLLTLGALAQTPAPAMKPAAKAEKKAKTVAVKSDADIQSDIQKRLAAAPKLKSESITVEVSNAVATFSGTVSNAGSKGAVNGLAKAAGAKSVVNKITIVKPAAPAKK